MTFQKGPSGRTRLARRAAVLIAITTSAISTQTIAIARTGAAPRDSVQGAAPLSNAKSNRTTTTSATSTTSPTTTLASTTTSPPAATTTTTATTAPTTAATTTTTLAAVTTTTATASPLRLVTSEGVTIEIASDVVGWTPQRIVDLLKPNAFELSRLGSRLTIKVQNTYASSTTTSAATTGSTYTYFRATIYLDARSSSTFTARPEAVVAHEYGHAWTMFHLYLSHQGNWSSYLIARGLTSDARVDTSYNWSKTEMIADDYRMLFGTATAISTLAYINSGVPDPRLVPGLRDWFVNRWSRP